MLNSARIDELKSEVGEDDFIEVVSLFCEEVEEVLSELPGAAASDLPGLLHFLKGSAFNIGLDHVGTLCQAEEARIQKDPGEPPDVSALLSAYQSAKSALLG